MGFKYLLIESFLQARTKRERLLLFIVSVLLGFALIVALGFKGVQSKIAKERLKYEELSQMVFTLQNTLSVDSYLEVQDLDSILKAIRTMEQKIITQEEYKRLALQKVGVYFLQELASVNALYGVEISQTQGEIQLEVKGNYNAILSFLEYLQTQPKISLHTMQLYPNPSTMDLTLFAILQIKGK